MKCRIFSPKCCLGFFNLLLMLCGVVVLLTGFYLFTDNKRLLLSSLLIVADNGDYPLKDMNYPLFLYVAFMLTVMGMLMVSITFIGYWTSLLNSWCLLSLYFVLVLFLLLIKFAVCIVITLWPQFLGLNLNATEMVKIMQGSYGVPGSEHYTVAMDFAQTYLDCCAINDSINYDTSLWRLNSFGKKELTVPTTCCHVMNKFEANSYLDPIAINETLCQSLDQAIFQKSRHTEGCLKSIEYWYREHYIVLLCAGLILALLEFFVLLSVVLNCTQIKQNRMSKMITPMKFFNEEQSSSRTDSFQRNMTRQNIYQEDFISITPEIRETFVQPADLNRIKYSRNFTGTNYRRTNDGFLI